MKGVARRGRIVVHAADAVRMLMSGMRMEPHAVARECGSGLATHGKEVEGEQQESYDAAGFIDAVSKLSEQR